MSVCKMPFKNSAVFPHHLQGCSRAWTDHILPPLAISKNANVSKQLQIFKLFLFSRSRGPRIIQEVHPYMMISRHISKSNNKMIYPPPFFNRSSSGVYNYQVEEDISKLKASVNSLLQEYNLNVNIKDDYIHEL